MHNSRLLSVTKYLMSSRNCDWQNEMRRKRFVCEKDLFSEKQLEWLNIHVLDACLQEKFIVCKAWKTIHILKSLCTSINISSHTCDMLSSRTAECCCNIPKRDYVKHTLTAFMALSFVNSLFPAPPQQKSIPKNFKKKLFEFLWFTWLTTRDATRHLQALNKWR